MVEPKPNAFRSGPTRRDTMIGGLGLLTSLLAPRANAKAIDNPPVFETARHQYTMIEPLAAMKSVPVRRLDGTPAALAPSAGKVTLISFWATWCVNCRTDLPALALLQRTMGKRVQVDAVSVDRKDRESIQQFVSDIGVHDLALYWDSLGVLGDLNNKVGGQFPIVGMPITYLVTPAGLIAGYVTETADWLSPSGQRLISYYEN